MSTPSVCCLMLTADRQRLTDRAVRCFASQTYENSWLLIYDTGAAPYELPRMLPREISSRIVVVHAQSTARRTVGTLRNEAIEMAGKAAVIAHWDSDDWSAPERLAIQVPALQMHASFRAVGFHNMLFLDARAGLGRAWEYDHRRGDRAIGASLVYWRKTWERQPFNEAKMVGEDTEWHQIVPTRGLNGVAEPLLIAEVHGANTSGVYSVFDNHQPATQPEWRRAPEFDVYCREKLYP